MFTVRTKKFQQDYELWTDALENAKSLMPKCGWFDEVQILEKGNLVWAYSRGYKYPRFIGAGTYDRLAKRFVLESTEAPPTELSQEHGEDRSLDSDTPST